MKYLFFLIIFLQLQSYAQVADNVNTRTLGRFISKSAPNPNLYVEITPTYAFHTGDLSDIYNNGYGGLFSINHRLKSSEIIFVELVYVSFKGKQINVNYTFTLPSFIHIPKKIGVKHYKKNFIWGIGVGTGISKLDGVNESTTKLMINPIVGYDFGPIILGVNYSITATEKEAGITRNTNKYLGVRLSLKL